LLSLCGFKIGEARVGELGPGDSIGIGLAALLSGASGYIGLDIFPFSARADLQMIFEELVQLYSQREAIPGNDEFPRIRPKLESYDFPNDLVNWTDFSAKAETIGRELQGDSGGCRLVEYKAPWTSPREIDAASLDLIFSQAVLEHVDDLNETYKAMFLWLKSGAYASHVIDFTAHGLSPFWNGHWAYSPSEWRLVRGRREFLLNREPLSAHLACIERAGLKIAFLERKTESNGLSGVELSERYRGLDTDDIATSGAVMILRKP
jgi:hypothetical protein